MYVNDEWKKRVTFSRRVRRQPRATENIRINSHSLTSALNAFAFVAATDDNLWKWKYVFIRSQHDEHSTGGKKAASKWYWLLVTRPKENGFGSNNDRKIKEYPTRVLPFFQHSLHNIFFCNETYKNEQEFIWIERTKPANFSVLLHTVYTIFSYLYTLNMSVIFCVFRFIFLFFPRSLALSLCYSIINDRRWSLYAER